MENAKFKYRCRADAIDMWDRPGVWSNVYVIACTDKEAYDYFGISPGEQPFYSLMKKPYSGKLKPGTKRRISW